MWTKPSVYMGTMQPSWGANKKLKNITFSVTDECNLRCVYCYFTHKTHRHVLSFETAQKAIDDILSESLYDNYDAVIWDFIGGEPTLEMELIDKISDYILYRMYKMNHKWLQCYRFMIGTNGLLYDSEPVQNYIKKHHGNLYVAITIDGTKEKHDLSRIKKDGSGSYDDVRRIIPLWQKQFHAESTKATFAHADLPFLKDSIVNLWNMGLKSIAANVVFEDVWKDGDIQIYKQQLYSLADYIIEKDLWEKYSVRFFDPSVGTPSNDSSMRRNFCGTGTMLAVNTEGDYYPCVRFMPSATDNHSFEPLGSIAQKISSDRLRAFSVLSGANQSENKCLTCDVAGGCSWCSGVNYDCSSIGTLYERQTYICEMHKANVEVNKYLWRQYELRKHKISPYRYNKLTAVSSYNKFMYVLERSTFPSFCECVVNDRNPEEAKYMSAQTLDKVIEFCDTYNYVPVFCGFEQLPDDYYGYQMVLFEDYIKANKQLHPNYIPQLLVDVDQLTDEDTFEGIFNIIITATPVQLNKLLRKIQVLGDKVKHLNISYSIQSSGVNPEEYIKEYKKFLTSVTEYICECWKKGNFISVSSITNELFANNNRYCGAGKNNYTISPEGNIYLCPNFYKHNPNDIVGSVETGKISNKYSKYCDMDNAPLCKDCSVRHCKRCIYMNKTGTGEYHIPTELQCVLAHMEYVYAKKISDLLNSGEISIPLEYNSRLQTVEFFDPIERIRGENYLKRGYSQLVKSLGL